VVKAKTVSQIIREVSDELAEVSSSAQLDAELLFMHAFDWSRTQLFIKNQESVEADQLEVFHSLIQRRKQGEPIAYIIGEQEFWSLPLQVNKDTLIPRPETEHLVEEALKKIPLDVSWDIIDLGAGSGAIALAVASERKASHVLAVDLSESALAVAENNSKKLNIGNVKFVFSSWFTRVPQQQFHIVLSNPPYIEESDEHLSQGDVFFEPRSALVSGTDGLDDIRQISSSAYDYLHPNGWLMFEHGWNQAEKVQQILKNNGYQQISSINDLANIPRITIGCKPK